MNPLQWRTLVPTRTKSVTHSNCAELRVIFLYVFGLAFEFSFSLTEGDSTPTVRQTYIRQVLFQHFLFWLPLEMPLAKPTCRGRSVEGCLSLFSSSTNSEFLLYLRRTLGCACESLLSLQEDHWWMKNMYPKASFSHISWNQAMLWSAVLLEHWPAQALCCIQKGSAERPSFNRIFTFFFPQVVFISHSTECTVRKWNLGWRALYFQFVPKWQSCSP